MPHVLVNRVLDQPESPGCTVDNAGGHGASGRLLAGLGHRRVAAIQGPTDTSTGRERALGLRSGPARARGCPAAASSWCGAARSTTTSAMAAAADTARAPDRRPRSSAPTTSSPSGSCRRPEPPGLRVPAGPHRRRLRRHPHGGVAARSVSPPSGWTSTSWPVPPSPCSLASWAGRRRSPPPARRRSPSSNAARTARRRMPGRPPHGGTGSAPDDHRRPTPARLLHT